jgi:guanylate kinase
MRCKSAQEWSAVSTDENQYRLDTLDSLWDGVHRLLKDTAAAHPESLAYLTNGESSQVLSQFLYAKGPQLLGLAGAGCTGKSSVLHGLVTRGGWHRIRNVTTRSPRADDRPMVDYFFVDNSSIEAGTENGTFGYMVERPGRGKYALFNSDLHEWRTTGGRAVVIERPLTIAQLFAHESRLNPACSTLLIVLLPKSPACAHTRLHLSQRGPADQSHIDDALGERLIEEISSIGVAVKADLLTAAVFIGAAPTDVVDIFASTERGVHDT